MSRCFSSSPRRRISAILCNKKKNLIDPESNISYYISYSLKTKER